MSDTLEDRLYSNYEKAINEGRHVMVRVCTILLKGIPVSERFIGLSNGEKKKLGYNIDQIRYIESGLMLNDMDISLLLLNIRAFGELGPGPLHDLLKQFKGIRNDFVHEKQLMSLNRENLITKLSELKALFTSIIEELKSYCDPDIIPLLDHDISQIGVRLLSLEKTLDYHILEQTADLVKRTESLTEASATAESQLIQFSQATSTLDETVYKFNELMKAKDSKLGMHKLEDEDSLFIDSVKEGNIKMLTLLSKNTVKLDIEYIQLAHDIALNQGNHAITRLTQFALDKKKMELLGATCSRKLTPEKPVISGGKDVNYQDPFCDVPEDRLLATIRIRSEHIEFKQGSILGVGGDCSQDYTLVLAQEQGHKKEFVYIQKSYPHESLINMCDLQCGSYEITNGQMGVFFVYHNKSQKPSQNRFGLKAHGIDNQILKAINEDIGSRSLPGYTVQSSLWHFNGLRTNYLHDYKC